MASMMGEIKRYWRRISDYIYMYFFEFVTNLLFRAKFCFSRGRICVKYAYCFVRELLHKLPIGLIDSSFFLSYLWIPVNGWLNEGFKKFLKNSNFLEISGDNCQGWLFLFPLPRGANILWPNISWPKSLKIVKMLIVLPKKVKIAPNH